MVGDGFGRRTDRGSGPAIPAPYSFWPRDQVSSAGPLNQLRISLSFRPSFVNTFHCTSAQNRPRTRQRNHHPTPVDEAAAHHVNDVGKILLQAQSDLRSIRETLAGAGGGGAGRDSFLAGDNLQQV